MTRFVLVVALISASPTAAVCGYLPSHALVYASGSTYGGSGPVVNIEGGSPLNTGVVHETLNDPYLLATSSQGITDATAQRFLKSAASVTIQRSTDYPDIFTFEDAVGRAAWRDIIYPESVNHPQAVRLNFVLDANLSASVDPSVNLGGGNRAVVGVDVGVGLKSSPFDPFFGVNNHDLTDAFGSKSNVQYDSATGYQFSLYANASSHQLSTDARSGYNGGPMWDIYTYSYTTQHFTGFFHLDVSYDDYLHGYPWYALLSSHAIVGSYGSATADALHTLRLLSLTTVDGASVYATFDSGLTFTPSAVPEPASVALLGLGAAGLVGARLRRRA